MRSTDSMTNRVMNQNIINIFCTGSKIGGAYYSCYKDEFYMMDEIINTEPNLDTLKSILRDISPSMILTMGNASNTQLQDIIDDFSINEHDSINQKKSFALSLREYSYDKCKNHLLTATLLWRGRVKRNQIHSFVNFENRISVHALGALSIFISSNWKLFSCVKPALRTPQQDAIKHHVLIDKQTQRALKLWPLSAKNNLGYNGSLITFFSQYCTSALSFKMMRHLLNTPINNIQELNRRVEFISLGASNANCNFVKTLFTNLKVMNNSKKSMSKIKYGASKGIHWRNIYKNLCACLTCREYCEDYKHVQIIKSYCELFDDDLYILESCIRTIINVTKGLQQFPVIYDGTDEELDNLRNKKIHLRDHLVMVATNDLKNMIPSNNVKDWNLVCLPHFGHAIAIAKFSNDNIETSENWTKWNLQFLFELNNILYFKNTKCSEIDKEIDALDKMIETRERLLITILSEMLLQKCDLIFEILRQSALIECLLSVSVCSSRQGFTQPIYNNDNVYDIRNSTQIILESISQNYIPNNYLSGSNASKVKIITGANGSGKSVYMKQIATVIYIAHIGFSVPAEYANISLRHSIHFYSPDTETALSPLCGLEFDITQLSRAIRTVNKSSLIFIDEFGRGTLSEDGKHLIMACIEVFLKRNENCPHVLISTHFDDLRKRLLRSDLLHYQFMDYALRDEGVIYLYKLVDGESSCLAFNIIHELNFEQLKQINSRAYDIYKSNMVLPIPRQY